MKNFRHSKALSKRSWALLISVALLLAITVGGTVAYLFAGAEKDNNFKLLADSDITVTEQLDGNVKKNVAVRNSSEYDAYVRAAVVVTWYNADGAVIPEPTVADGQAIVFSALGGEWVKLGDHYYHKAPVQHGTTSGELFSSITVAPGLKADVTVMAQSIQAVPVKAVEQAWGVNVNSETGLITGLK